VEDGAKGDGKSGDDTADHADRGARAAGWTRARARALDELVIGTFGIPGIVLMEHAGRSVAEAIQRDECDALARAPGPEACVVFCGGGNNGGDGFVIARWLDDALVRVACVCTASADDTRGDARLAREAAERAGIRLHAATTEDELGVLRARWTRSPPRVIVDALLGTGFVASASGRGLRADMARAIACVNGIGALPLVRTWAVDLPSGLDCDSGEPADPTVRADVTATFVAPKQGFACSPARPFLGRVLVLPIGAPRAAVERVSAP
jgi:NAD(P)H-hydrate epimerase